MRILDNLPLLGTLILVGVAGWCEAVGEGGFFLYCLSTSHIGADHSLISDDLSLP
jgi:hypothetical protein